MEEVRNCSQNLEETFLRFYDLGRMHACDTLYECSITSQSEKEVDFLFSDDVERIRRVSNLRGTKISSYEARSIWQIYSDELCATWLVLPESDEKLYEIILKYYNKTKLA